MSFATLHVSVQRLQDEFELPRACAQEIASEQTRLALLQHWQAWAWLASCATTLAGGILLGWLPSPHALLQHPVSWELPLILLGLSWLRLGRWLAGPAMLAAAASEARRRRLRAKAFSA